MSCLISCSRLLCSSSVSGSVTGVISVTELDFTDTELRVATGVANRITRLQRNLVESDDVRSECYLWMCKNPSKVYRWRDEGKKGKAKLGTALYRAGMRWATRERAKITNTQPGDHTFYSLALLEELLPDVFDYESWGLDSHVDETAGRTPSKPGEGNTRLAMLVDVSFAVDGLSDDDRGLLRDRYADGGLPVQALAATHDVSESTMRRKIKNILIKLADRLGGEPPWV